jgi:hypothetical protein
MITHLPKDNKANLSRKTANVKITHPKTPPRIRPDNPVLLPQWGQDLAIQRRLDPLPQDLQRPRLPTTQGTL